MRHDPASHRAACHCGAPAEVHAAYGSGCGNVCHAHAAAIKAAKGGMYSEGKLVFAAPVDIAGPMGRGYLMLPCKHQRASLADPCHARTPARRTCQACGARYVIEVVLPPPGSEREATAQITRTN